MLRLACTAFSSRALSAPTRPTAACLPAAAPRMAPLAPALAAALMRAAPCMASMPMPRRRLPAAAAAALPVARALLSPGGATAVADACVSGAAPLVVPGARAVEEKVEAVGE